MTPAVAILAGGAGQRLWPVSRRTRPKQFLPLDRGRSLLAGAIERALLLTSPQRVAVIAPNGYGELCRAELSVFPEVRLLIEPAARDTAAAAGLATLWAEATGGDEPVLVLPSDHRILDHDRFKRAAETALATAISRAAVVLFGLRPTRPEKAFGYIECHATVEPETAAAPVAQAVARFVEKPDAARALEFMESGRHLWNSGMFVWRPTVFLDCARRHLPDLATGLTALRRACIRSGSFDPERLASRDARAAYDRLPKVSVDFGLLQSEQNLWVVPSDFDWDDLGNWSALVRELPHDEAGNAVLAICNPASRAAVIVDGRDCAIVVQAPGRLVAAFGMEDTMVIDTPDATLICPTDRLADLKVLVEELRRRGFGAWL